MKIIYLKHQNPKYKKNLLNSVKGTLCATVFLLSLSTISFAQELDVVGNGGNTFALRNDVGVSSTLWQSFYPDEGSSYKAFLQSWSSGQFDVAAVGGDMRFYSGSAYNMYLTSDARLGLGTSTPDGKLEIVHNSSSGAAGVPHIDIHEDANNDFARIKFTSNSSDFWSLAGAGGTTDKFNIFYHDGTSGTNRLSVDAVDGTTITGAENNGTIAALTVTTGSQTMIMDGNEIDSDGGIHFNFNSGFDVNMRTNVDRADVNMKHTSGSGFDDGFAIENEGANNNWWTLYTINANGDLELYANGLKRGEFDSASGVYNATSDRNRKKDIRSLNNILEKVMLIEPSVYKFKDDEQNKDYLGFIAQDIEPYFPEVVNRGTVGDTEEQLYTMDYSALGVIAIEAIQEQQTIITTQQNEIDTMKEMLEELTSRISELEK